MGAGHRVLRHRLHHGNHLDYSGETERKENAPDLTRHAAILGHRARGTAGRSTTRSLVGRRQPDPESRPMSATIVTCTCGAKVRLPAAPTEQVMRCPRCKAAMPAANVAAVEVRSTAVASGVGPLCPICQTTTSGTAA